jgi:hypothetical protein
MTVVGSMAKQALIRGTTLKKWGRLSINEKNSRRDNLIPEVRWKLRGE